MPLRYNWQRGSPSEGKPLFDLACDILNESSIKSADSRRLKVSVPQIIFTFKDVESLLGLVDRNERSNPENTNGNGGYENASNWTYERNSSPETPNPAVTGAHDSMQGSQRSSAKDEKSSKIGSKDLRDNSRHPYHSPAQGEKIADNGSEEGQTLDLKQDSHAEVYATLEKGLSLIAEQKYFEAIGSLMAVKDSVSAFQAATSQKYQIYLSASRNIGILYWLNDNMDLSLQTLLRTLTLYQVMARKGNEDPLL